MNFFINKDSSDRILKDEYDEVNKFKDITHSRVGKTDIKPLTLSGRSDELVSLRPFGVCISPRASSRKYSEYGFCSVADQRNELMVEKKPGESLILNYFSR